MKINIELDIKTCNQCPYHKWDEDNSESNHSGVSICKKANCEIEWDDKKPKVPKWCPCKVKKETVNKTPICKFVGCKNFNIKAKKYCQSKCSRLANMYHC